MHDNAILARLSQRDRELVTPHLSIIPLEMGDVLAEMHQKISRVYFPHSGILSFVVELPGGGAIETGMMGRDGVFGTNPALDEQLSMNRVAVQAPGEASVMEISKLRDLALELPLFRKLLIGYEQFFLAQVQQTSACNAIHKVPQRLAKWLLRMRDLSGDDLPLTQEFLAQMIGVRRTSVTEAAQHFNRLGMIEYRRGQLRIKDVAGLKRHTCECHAEINGHYQRIFDPDPFATN